MLRYGSFLIFAAKKVDKMKVKVPPLRYLHMCVITAVSFGRPCLGHGCEPRWHIDLSRKVRSVAQSARSAKDRGAFRKPARAR
jgi:hypothetical protein